MTVQRSDGMRVRRTAGATMLLTALASLLSVLFAYIMPAGLGVALAADADADYCRNGAVIIVAGTDDPDGAHMIGIRQRYSGLGPTGQPDPSSPYHENEYALLDAVYPTALWPIGAFSYDEDVKLGHAAAVEQVREYRARCGEDKEIVIVGFSQGARVAGDVLSDIGNGRIDGIEADNIRGELYADPRRDGSVLDRGIELSLVGIIPGIVMAGPRDGGFGSVPVVTVCVRGDGVCDMPDPLRDPIGALDTLLGYFVKHGFYPFRFYLDPAGGADNNWASTCTPLADNPDTLDCIVDQPSAASQIAHRPFELLGLSVPSLDLLDYRPIFPLPTGLQLADLQPALRPLLQLFPGLPQLGYGGYVTDLLVLMSVVKGFVSLDVDEFTGGIRDLADSAWSIVMMPVNFVRYWGGRIEELLAGHGVREIRLSGAELVELGIEPDSPAPDRRDETDPSAPALEASVTATVAEVAPAPEPSALESSAPATSETETVVSETVPPETAAPEEAIISEVPEAPVESPSAPAPSAPPTSKPATSEPVSPESAPGSAAPDASGSAESPAASVTPEASAVPEPSGTADAEAETD